ncbi:MAG TPA: outer membrane lipoprotein chaperone LolA [Gemmatimonadaceae bacterium]|nr:outer membrane lipoprotein chaperone LolA [Gemmatimonadaceae bacterium]
MQLGHFRALALAGALLAPLSLAAARPRAQADLLDRAVAAWAKVRTARATFEQTITNPLTGRTLTATGEYQQQRPGKLSVRFSDPANDRIVADGTRLWLYLPSTTPGQVIRTSVKNGGSGTVDLTAQFLTAPRTRYTITPAGSAQVSGRATHAFGLVPKQKDGAAFQSATVWIDDADATIRQFEVTEPSGVQRRVRLTSFRPNAPVDASAFRFVVPEGVRVVER